MRPINLLPAEAFRERARIRRRLLWIALAVVYVVALGALVFWWEGRVGRAEDELETQQEFNDDLRAQILVLDGARQLREQYDNSVGIVRTVLKSEVDWGRILNDLGRLLPPRVWLESFAGAVIPETPELEVSALGGITVAGVGFDYPDVSAWLRSLDSDVFMGITATWVMNAAEAIIGPSRVVRFNSSAAVTQDAAAERADELIPEVPE